jgi:hypothetical protein
MAITYRKVQKEELTTKAPRSHKDTQRKQDRGEKFLDRITGWNRMKVRVLSSDPVSSCYPV